MTIVLPTSSLALAFAVALRFPLAPAVALEVLSGAVFCAALFCSSDVLLDCPLCGAVAADLAAAATGGAGGLANNSCTNSSCRMASSAVGEEKNLPVRPSNASPVREDSGMPRAFVVKLFPA